MLLVYPCDIFIAQRFNSHFPEWKLKRFVREKKFQKCNAERETKLNCKRNTFSTKTLKLCLVSKTLVESAYFVTLKLYGVSLWGWGEVSHLFYGIHYFK